MKHEGLHDIDRFFTRRMFARQYLPALISAVVLSFGDVADSLVLGNSIGYIGLAALALTMPVCQVFNVIMNALGIGGSVRYATYMAEGRQDKALSGFCGVVCVTALSGILIGVLGNLFLTPVLSLLGTVPADGALFSAAQGYLRILLFGAPLLFLDYVLYDYLKADNREKQANVAFTAANITDITLNIVFVPVLRMGVTGAALATVIGQAVGVTISLISVQSHRGPLRLDGLKPDFGEAWRSFKVGFSSSVEFLYSMAFLLVANRLLLRTFGDGGVAVLDVVLSVSYFMINLYDAVAKSIIPVVSTYSGERNENGMGIAKNTGLKYSVITGLALALIVFLFPEAICRFFGMDGETLLETGRTALRFYACSIPLAGIGILLINYYEAKQELRMTLLISSLRGLLPILLAVLFTLLAPQEFWSLFLIAEAAAVAVSVLWRRLRPGRGFDPERVFRATLYSTSNEISRTTEEIQAFAEKWAATPAQQYMTMMAVEEICVATMNNGFRGEADGFIQIVLVAAENHGFVLHIRDNAASFNPLAMELGGKVTDEHANLEALGVAMIRKKARDFSYRHYQGFNTVIINL